jgi:hypothetical protein
MATLKIDKGTAQRLTEWTNISEDDSKNLIGKEVTLEIKDNQIIIERDKDTLEISDVNGSFGLWIKLDENRLKKLKGP